MRSGIILLLAPLLTTSAMAASEPLWELGLGISGLSYPAYRGSDRQQSLLLPLPYLIYRGERLRLDRGGLRGLVFDSRRVNLDLSLNAAVPVRSSDIPERTGMENLDPTFEVGPSINIGLSDASWPVQVQLKLPVRAVFRVNTDQGLRDVGALFHPRLSLRLPPLKGGWFPGLSAGPIFADRRYHHYYYGVGLADETPQRQRYEGRPGYSGTSLLFSLSKRFPNYWVAGFARYDNLAGAVFEDSPLVTSEHALMVGIGVAWVIRRSDEKVGN